MPDPTIPKYEVPLTGLAHRGSSRLSISETLSPPNIPQKFEKKCRLYAGSWTTLFSMIWLLRITANLLGWSLNPDFHLQLS